MTLWQEYKWMRPFDGLPPSATAWGATHKKAFDWELYCIEHMLRSSERASVEVERDRYRQTSHPIEYRAPVERKPPAEPRPPDPLETLIDAFIASLRRTTSCCMICGAPGKFMFKGSQRWVCVNHLSAFIT